MEKKVTIREVAKEAGVAISTVSNALNGSDLVKDETRKKILEVAKRLGYIPNMSGKILKGGRSKQLCFLTSTVTGEYFVKLIDAVNRTCIDHGYGLNIAITWDRDLVMKQLLGGQFDGFFIFEGERIQKAELDTLKREQIPIVMFDRKYESDCISSIVFDSCKVSREMTTYLIGLGHRRFCFVDSTPDTYDAVERKRGFMQALEKGGIEPKTSAVIQGYFDENVTFSAILALDASSKLANIPMPTAYVCGNDKSAIGAIKALSKLGYSVPAEVSVVGFDDIELAQYFQPALTTVRNPIEQQGRIAVEMMIDMLDKGGTGRVDVLKGSIVARNSTWICGK